MLRLVFFLLVSLLPLQAHQVEQHFVRLHLEEDRLRAQFEMDTGYALPELRRQEDETLPTYSWFDALASTDRERIAQEGEAYLRDNVLFLHNGKPLPLEFRHESWQSVWPQHFERRPDTFARMSFEITSFYPKESGQLEIWWQEDEEGPSLALGIVSDQRELPLLTVSQGEIYSIAVVGGLQEPKTASPSLATFISFWGWLTEGFRHVIPLGLDHILFILGLFLLTPSWKTLLTQSLLFTLAHSITLALTVSQIIPFKGEIIEPLIALSIAYIAIENLFLKEKIAKARIVVIFCLGLLHGMGFGSVMAELPVSRDALLLPILGFNLGIEIAQISTLTCAVLLTFWWNKKPSYEKARFLSCLLLGGIGLFLFGKRLFPLIA